MVSVYDVKLKGYSVEEYENYCIFDEDGFICGVKDDAPPEFKDAYEADKAEYAKLWEQGLYP